MLFTNLVRMMSTASASVPKSITNPFVRSRRNLIAVCQLTSRNDFESNLNKAEAMIRRAAEHKCRMVFLPECFDGICPTRQETIERAVEERSGLIGRYRQLARETGLWLSLGGFHHRSDSVPGSTATDMPFNTHLLLDDSGETAASYQKLHLFDVDIPGKVRLMESEFSVAGRRLVAPVATPIGAVGLAICYDVRFPELALWNRYQGAEVLTYPSAFTVPTGLAHWEALLRARAIETQCYVVAAAQTGKHNDKRISYGHSMVVDPWGAVVAQCSEAEDLCLAEINLDYLDEVRQLQPVFAHRRHDLYTVEFRPQPEGSNVGKNQDGEDGHYDFGGHRIPKECVFATTENSFAFVNLKPLVPGHVLCAPFRRAKRLVDLSAAETADLFNLAKRVQRVLEKHHSANASSMGVQDGEEAGQTVAHVHVHLLPRREGDVGGEAQGGSIFSQLQGHEETRTARSVEDMVEEAAIYREMMMDHGSL